MRNKNPTVRQGFGTIVGVICGDDLEQKPHRSAGFWDEPNTIRTLWKGTKTPPFGRVLGPIFVLRSSSFGTKTPPFGRVLGLRRVYDASEVRNKNPTVRQGFGTYRHGFCCGVPEQKPHRSAGFWDITSVIFGNKGGTKTPPFGRVLGLVVASIEFMGYEQKPHRSAGFWDLKPNHRFELR